MANERSTEQEEASVPLIVSDRGDLWGGVD